MAVSLLILFGLRAVLAGCCVLLAIWTQVPVLTLVGLSELGLSSLLTESPGPRAAETRQTWLIAAWVFTIVTAISAVFSSTNIWDGYYALIAWCLAGATCLAAISAPHGSIRVWWKRLSITWAFFGLLVWLGWAYLQDLRGTFLAGLGLAVIVLIVFRILFRPGALGIQAINTAILLCLFLPVVDWASGLRKTGSLNDEVAGNGYSYEADKGNPRLFRNWASRSAVQITRMSGQCLGPDPTGVLPYRLIPNSHAALFQSRFQINSLGFRGKEIPKAKGNAYRIVALGESTTFGIGLLPDYRPWPELLEQMIRQRINPARPVEVINAGIPGFSIENNVRRLPTDILPLKPDMIISYHGWNGFHFFSDALPPVFGRHLPVFKARPLQLLAECEYRLKMIYSKHRLLTRKALAPPPVSNLMATTYAKAYEELISVAASNHIRLVLANYSMAVNAASPSELVDFYREGYPALYWQIEANQMHTRLVGLLAREHDLCLVDTHPYLDGRHQFFIDSIHFTQDGDRMMAETMFQGIKPILEKECSAHAVTKSIPDSRQTATSKEVSLKH